MALFLRGSCRSSPTIEASFLHKFPRYLASRVTWLAPRARHYNREAARGRLRVRWSWRLSFAIHSSGFKAPVLIPRGGVNGKTAPRRREGDHRKRCRGFTVPPVSPRSLLFV